MPARTHRSLMPITIRPVAGALAVLLAVTSSQPGLVPPAAGGESDAPNLLFAVEVAEPGVPVDHLVLVFDEIIDPDSIPAAADFVITFEATGTPVTGTAIEHIYSGFGSPAFISAGGLSFLKLTTLPATMTSDDDLRLDYTPNPDPDAPRIRDLALNETSQITNFQDVAILDPDDLADPMEMGPMDFAGGVIDGDHGDDVILLFFNRPIDPDSLPAADDFRAAITGPDNVTEIVTPESVSLFRPDINIGMLDLRLPDPVTKDDEVVLDYTPNADPDAPRIRSTDTGADAEAIVDEPITVVLPTVSASATFGEGGGTVSTADGSPPTVSDPMATTVTSSAAGGVTIAESTSTDPAPAGYSFFGQQVEITAPSAPDAGHPIAITFVIDASIVPPGQDENSIVVARNGVPFADACAPSGVASPSPCIDGRSSLDGDISITVLTLDASTWNLAVPPLPFSGFDAPIDESPTLNRMPAGRAVPLKFSIGGDHGLDIFAAGSPGSRQVDCDAGAGLDVVEETVTAGSSTLQYSPDTDTYTYVWKTSSAWSGTCRRLTLTFFDGSTAEALFDFRR
jgi:hypothetical protein